MSRVSAMLAEKMLGLVTLDFIPVSRQVSL